ncbi:MAG: acetyl-CoA carboxylase biotin carboxyl carrier protein subunit [Bacteroidales bacterium]
MNREELPLEEMDFEGSRYKTLLTKKFQQRQPYSPEDLNKIIALIPGTILKILVKEGQQVNPSKCLFILEAMKMKNKVFASISGTISKIHIAEGQVVTKNQLLLELGEPEAKTESKKKEKKAPKERKIKRFSRRSKKKSDE